MKQEEFHAPLLQRFSYFAVSPRPGLWLGTCWYCREWRPLPTMPLNEAAFIFHREFDPDARIKIDRDATPSVQCQRCKDWRNRKRTKQEKAQEKAELEARRCSPEYQDLQRQQAEQQAEHEVTLQCVATTKRGKQCRMSTVEWDYPTDPDLLPEGKPFVNRYYWVCWRHAPDCPHCAFTGKGLWGIRLQTWLLRDGSDEDYPAGRGLRCSWCGCTFDPRLELIEESDDCPVWGTGPKPGTRGWYFVNEPEVIRDGMAYAHEAVRKHRRLKEWRKQLDKDKGSGRLVR